MGYIGVRAGTGPLGFLFEPCFDSCLCQCRSSGSGSGGLEIGFFTRDAIILWYTIIAVVLDESVAKY